MKELVRKVMPSGSFKMPFGMSDLNRSRSRIEKIIVLNTDYPIIISFSSDKILLSASQNAVLTRFWHAENLSILGLMRQVGKGFYTIKPVSMWEIFEVEKAGRSFMYQVERFREYWKKSD